MEERKKVIVSKNFTTPDSKKDNILNDGIGYVESFDFSVANLNYDNRVSAVSSVASICYQSPTALGSISLFDRLACEAHSLPSSSFEFIPMLIPEEIVNANIPNGLRLSKTLPILKYGVWIIVNSKNYLLTNYRAAIYTKEQYSSIDLTEFYNTQEECDIIKSNYFVFKCHVDIPTRSQMVRHRQNLQELCISGDSMIMTSQGPREIREMYKIQETNKSVKGYKYPTVKSYDFRSKSFFKAPVKEIFKTGIKEVFEITIQYGADGKTKKIKTSKDHKFLTKEGWKTLSDISVGDYLALNGMPAYRSKDWLQKQKEDFLAIGVGMKGMAESLKINYNTIKKWMHIHKLSYTQLETSSTFTVWNKNVKGEDSHSYGAVHSDVTRQKISDKHTMVLGTTNQGFGKRMRSYWEADFRRRLILAKYNHKCAECQSTESLELDHIKPVYSHPELGFNEDNVQILCKSCHKLKSAEENSLSKNTIRYGMVKSIVSKGDEETYDMEIAHRDRNYVANGIVVHNSRRYVSGKKLAFEFYISTGLKNFTSKYVLTNKDGHSQSLDFTTEDILDLTVSHYHALLDSGIKAQEARRIIPQAMYSTLWMGFNKESLSNYLKLREDTHAQWEIRQTAIAFRELITKNINDDISFFEYLELHNN